MRKISVVIGVLDFSSSSGQKAWELAYQVMGSISHPKRGSVGTVVPTDFYNHRREPVFYFIEAEESPEAGDTFETKILARVEGYSSYKQLKKIWEDLLGGNHDHNTEVVIEGDGKGLNFGLGGNLTLDFIPYWLWLSLAIYGSFKSYKSGIGKVIWVPVTIFSTFNAINKLKSKQ